MGGEEGGDVVADEGAAGIVPDAVEGEEVTAEAVGPEGSTEQAEAHAQGAGSEAQAAANKKPMMPAWRKKRPTLQGSRVRELLEQNFDRSSEAFESIDLNMDGKITMRELRAALAIIDSSIDFTDKELNDAIMIADYDGSGQVDATEFMRAFGPHPMVKEELQDGLHNMGKTADGRKLAYLSLNASDLNVSDVSLLREFAYLRYIDVSKNVLTDLSPLGCLPYLLTLNARDNALTTVLDFKPPLCLRTADLSNNRITAMNSLSAHRFLEELNLSGNQIRDISGVRANVALRKLVLDNNNLTCITNLGNLPLHHLSLANNQLTAVNGYEMLNEEDLKVFHAFEETYEEMELAFQAFDANQDGRLSAHEFRSGLKMIGVNITQATADYLLSILDRTGDGIIQFNEFLGHFRRSKPSDSNDPGISELLDLQEIDLSGNPIKSLKGLEGHARLRCIRMADSAIGELGDMQYLRELPLLDSLDLRGTQLFAKSETAAKSTCMRLRALYLLCHPHGKCKVTMLNGQLVSAEEMVSAANFHDPKHRQYQDVKRDDSQDLPPALFL